MQEMVSCNAAAAPHTAGNFKASQPGAATCSASKALCFIPVLPKGSLPVFGIRGVVCFLISIALFFPSKKSE